MCGNHPCIVAEVQDPICLKHFGCQEILKKIDLMEEEYNIPMRFDESLIPDFPAAAGGEHWRMVVMELPSLEQPGGIVGPERCPL